MARRVSRPLALRVTWLIAPWGVSAHAVTSLALLLSFGAAACFATGAPAGWLAGALLLQLWYLFDHVDGQVARLHGTASLDGIQLDYLMHHVVNLVVPCGLGCGVWRVSGGEYWLWAGLVFAIGTLVLGLANDTRYKAFVARLKELDGPLLVRSGGFMADDISANDAVPYGRFAQWLRRCVHLARKLCEVHVVMNAVTVVAIIQCLSGGMLLIEIYLAVTAALALITSVATVARDIRRGAAEREFAQWYVPPKPHERSLPPPSAVTNDQANRLRKLAAAPSAAMNVQIG
jgi:hypothetical protein